LKCVPFSIDIPFSALHGFLHYVWGLVVLYRFNNGGVKSSDSGLGPVRPCEHCNVLLDSIKGGEHLAKLESQYQSQGQWDAGRPRKRWKDVEHFEL
jgi:hypothetical protein